MFHLTRARIRLLAWAVMAGLWAAPGLAQRTVFNPSLLLEQSYTDNVAFAADGDVRLSDDTTRLTADLPLSRLWPGGSFDVLYRPSQLRHDRLSSLDRDEHFMRVHLGLRPQSGNRLDVSARFQRTQEQGAADSLDDAELFLSRRTDRDLLHAALDHDRRVGSRWRFRLQLTASAYDFEPVFGVETQTQFQVEDRNEYRGAVSFRRRLSGQAHIGFRAGHAAFDLDVSPDETSDSLRVVYDRRLSRETTLEFGVGGYRRGQDGSGGDLPDRNGVEGHLRLVQTFRSHRLTLDAVHQPSAGGSLIGTARHSALGVTLTSQGARRTWTWSLSPRFAHRDPFDATRTALTTMAFGARVSRALTARTLRLALRASWVEQRADDAQPDRSALVASLGLQWLPLAGDRISSR